MLGGMSGCAVISPGCSSSLPHVRLQLLILVLLSAAFSTATSAAGVHHGGPATAWPLGIRSNDGSEHRVAAGAADNAAAASAATEDTLAAVHARPWHAAAAADAPNATPQPHTAQQHKAEATVTAQGVLQRTQQQQQQQDQLVIHQRHLLTQQQRKQDVTPAQRAVAKWYEQQHQQQLLLAAGLPLPPPPVNTAGTAAAPGEFVIPVPPPGTDVPAETEMPLYSPDQLRIRHKLIPDVPMASQIISLGEQMQQAEALGVVLSKEQLENANPLLGPLGRVKVPEKTNPEEWLDGYVAICAIVKDQQQDIREWLEYHRWLGISKVYVYDNNSTVPLAATIADLMQSGFVEYAYFSGMPRYRDLFRTSSQWWAYNDCVHRFRHRHRWLAFIDADEFIMLQEPQYDLPSWQDQLKQQEQEEQVEQAAAGVQGKGGAGALSGSSGGGRKVHNIDTFMQQYEQYGGLALNWMIFGSSGYKSRPQGGVLVNYHACLPSQQEQNGHVKVIANTKYLMTVGDDPHRVYYNSPQHFTVNELGEQVTQARTIRPSHTKVALYHYLTKSEGEYMQKMRRGSAAGNFKSPEFFYTINQFATDTCTRAIPLGLKCCPSVEAELGADGVQQVKQRLVALQQAPAAPQAHGHR